MNLYLDIVTNDEKGSELKSTQESNEGGNVLGVWDTLQRY